MRNPKTGQQLKADLDSLLQLEVGQENQLIEEGPGDLIIVGNLRHFPIDALVQPSPSDNLDTGVGI